MAEIQIARIDYRLIHGQVVTKWMKAYPAKRIVIVAVSYTHLTLPTKLEV